MSIKCSAKPPIIARLIHRALIISFYIIKPNNKIGSHNWVKLKCYNNWHLINLSFRIKSHILIYGSPHTNDNLSFSHLDNINQITILNENNTPD